MRRTSPTLTGSFVGSLAGSLPGSLPGSLAGSLAGPLVALLLATKLAAQSADPSLDRRVDSVFANWSRTSTPGCALGVDRGGAPLLRRAYGMANLETGTPFTTGTISESGSVAKQFTATAIVLLALDGKLTLDDDIARWIPEVKGIGTRITVRNILTHTSGLPDRYLLHEVLGRPAGVVDHPNAEVMDVVAHLTELNFDPGEDYLYSNTGYVVAATIVERASGQSLQAFTNARIFTPLGMTSTRWREDHRTVVPGRASAYDGTVATGFRNDHPFTRVIGSGGLLVTVDDFLKWQSALQVGTGTWGAVRDSLEHTAVLNDGTALTYGLGVTADRWRGVRRISHTGSTGGYRAALYRFPEQQVAVALLCNIGSLNPGDLATRVATIVLGDALAPVAPEPTPIAVDPAQLAALAGAYHDPRSDEFLVIAVRNGQLVDSSTSSVLIPVSADLFKYRGSQRQLRVTRGTVPGIRAESPNVRSIEYLRVDRPSLTSAALATYAGKYTSRELGARIVFIVKDGALVADDGWRGTPRLVPVFRDAFEVGDVGRARFTRDAKGRITGFALWAGRVRHLRFDRE